MGLTRSLAIQIPLVQELTVGPTLKTYYPEAIITLFSRKDLPVRYLPRTLMTPIGVEVSRDDRCCLAYGFSWNFPLITLMNGIDI